MPLNIPTLAEVEAARAGKSFPKGPTRLEERIAERPVTRVTERQFKAEVWRRDESNCRCCGRKVQRTPSAIPERGEVNHLHGRTGDLRFEARAACLLCLLCHQRFTGKINDKIVAIGTQTFTTPQGTFIDARFPITFRKAA
jgi:hypothetical protein